MKFPLPWVKVVSKAVNKLLVEATAVMHETAKIIKVLGTIVMKVSKNMLFLKRKGLREKR
jgi:pectate lyase